MCSCFVGTFVDTFVDAFVDTFVDAYADMFADRPANRSLLPPGAIRALSSGSRALTNQPVANNLGVLEDSHKMLAVRLVPVGFLRFKTKGCNMFS